MWKLLVDFGGWIFNVPKSEQVLLNSINTLSNLPNVRFDEKLPFDSVSRQNKCLTSAVFISKNNLENYNCEQFCDTEGVSGRYIKEFETVIVGGRKLTPGFYCMRSITANCNASTTMTIFTEFGWNCISRMKEFGGIDGNKILACDGSLKDNLLDKVFVGVIPYNLKLTSIDELLPNSNKFRFECYKVRDIYNNDKISSPWSRTDLVINRCVWGLKNAVPVKVDWNNSTCDCKEFGLINQNGFCHGCRSEYDALRRLQILPTHCMAPEYINPDALELNVPICFEHGKNCIEFGLKSSWILPSDIYEKSRKYELEFGK